MFLLALFEKIKLFFLSLFSQETEEFKTQKALRAIMAELKTAQHPLFRADNTVLPGLPIIIYELYAALLPIKKLFTTTIGSNDIRISGFFLDAMIEKSFSESEKDLRESFKLEKRKSVFTDYLGEEFERLLKEQTKTFNDFISIFNNPKFIDADKIINKCYALFDLTNFKFNSFFAYFDESFKDAPDNNSIKEHYNFESVKGEKVLQDILDLDFLLRNVVVDDDLLDGIFLLNSKLNTEQQRDKDLIKRDINNFLFILDRHLGLNSLQNLAKLIKQDPLFKDTTTSSTKFSALLGYKQRLQASFNADTKKILKIQQDEKLFDIVNKLFHGMDLISLSVYNDNVNERIQALTIYAFDWVKPLEIINTFTKRFFEPNFQPFLRELIVEGFFEDKSFQSDLAADYYYCESISDKIEEFEKLTADNTDRSYAHINGLLTNIANGGDFEKHLGKIVDFLNVKAKILVEEIAIKYGNLFKACNSIVMDSHTTIPTFISNLKAMIISARNKDRFSIFESSIQRFEVFLDIIKKYAMVENPELKQN